MAPQEFHQDGNGPENVGIYNLSRGVNRFCLSKPGEPGRWECGTSLGPRVRDPGFFHLQTLLLASGLSLQLSPALPLVLRCLSLALLRYSLHSMKLICFRA